VVAFLSYDANHHHQHNVDEEDGNASSSSCDCSFCKDDEGREEGMYDGIRVWFLLLFSFFFFLGKFCDLGGLANRPQRWISHNLAKLKNTHL
jgi:hypothetical protein